MGIFKNKDQFEGYNIYSMKKYVDKKRMVFTITAIIAVIVTLSLTIFYLVDTTIRVKKAKDFAKQVTEFAQQQQEIENKKKEEENLFVTLIWPIFALAKRKCRNSSVGRAFHS